MTAFRFIFDDDDDEGFELVEEVETNAELEDDESEESVQASDDEVIWEVTED